MLLNCSLEKTLESPLDCKESQPVHPKGAQYWVFIGRTDVEAETPILWPPDGKSWLLGKDPDDGKDWTQEEKGMTEDEMVRWNHQLNGHKFEQAPGAGGGQEAWHGVHGVAKNRSWLSNWTSTTNFLEMNAPRMETDHHIQLLHLTYIWKWTIADPSSNLIPTQLWYDGHFQQGNDNKLKTPSRCI